MTLYSIQFLADWMSMEHTWYDTERENLSQCHCVHLNMDWSGNEPPTLQ